SPIINVSEFFTSRDKIEYSEQLHASFKLENGHKSIEELTCDEIDDILPKTDYTYARTATYSPKYLNKKYISPNMSRRKIHGSSMLALSDDENDDTHDSVFINKYTIPEYGAPTTNPSTEPTGTVASHIQHGSKSKGRKILTSTPIQPHGDHHISAHDHYYEGMVLRSGSHVKGQRFLKDKQRFDKETLTKINFDKTEQSRLDKNSDDTAFIQAPASTRSSKDLGDYHDINSFSHQNRSHNVITTITTTTTTYEDMEDESDENKLRVDQSDTEKRKQKNQEYSHEQPLLVERRYDQSEQFRMNKQNKANEYLSDPMFLKRDGKNQYRLKHLYGLDKDEDISDIDDTDWGASHTAKTATSGSSSSTDTVTSRQTGSGVRRSSGLSPQYSNRERFTSTYTGSSGARRTPWYLLITTFFTSLSTAISESVSGAGFDQFVSSTANTLSTVLAPVRWLLRPLSSLASWLIVQSYTLLLWDIQAKHRKRRGCCCLLLPLLFLLPLFLLAGYYLHDAQQSAFNFISGAGQVIGSSLSYLWLTTSSDSKAVFREVPVPPVPVAYQSADIAQVNMTHIHQYIQQTVIQATAGKRDDRPVGLTREQVEDIVQVLLSAQMKGLTIDLNDKIESFKVLLAKDDVTLTTLETNLKGLQDEVKRASTIQLAMNEGFDNLKKSWESSQSKDSLDWQAAFEVQQQKLLDLSAQVASLSSQNAALTALVSNCCRNNTLTVDIVRAQTLAILSQMGTDGNGPLADLVNKATGQFVDRSELDVKLAALSSQIMDNLKVMLAAMEKESEVKNETVVQTALVGGLDEMTVKIIVEEALIQFSADRVGMPDFALESAGGSVLSVRCSETFYKKTALVSVFGIPLWYTSNSPRTVIQPNVNPGECWAFKGTSGYLVLQLSHPIQPTGFTLEHIPRSLSPKGDISSAPKEFTVFGLTSENDFQGINLGNYTYLDNGKPIQFFPVQNQSPRIFQHIELRILSNHGNKEYTCIYRFRVHGLP
ncbi:SUN domain-containing protein 1, partial [Biomphalaria glabrata]